jgi:hypothetical protein
MLGFPGVGRVVSIQSKASFSVVFACWVLRRKVSLVPRRGGAASRWEGDVRPDQCGGVFPHVVEI